MFNLRISFLHARLLLFTPISFSLLVFHFFLFSSSLLETFSSVHLAYTRREVVEDLCPRGSKKFVIYEGNADARVTWKAKPSVCRKEASPIERFLRARSGFALLLTFKEGIEAILLIATLVTRFRSPPFGSTLFRDSADPEYAFQSHAWSSGLICFSSGSLATEPLGNCSAFRNVFLLADLRLWYVYAVPKSETKPCITRYSFSHLYLTSREDARFCGFYLRIDICFYDANFKQISHLSYRFIFFRLHWIF